jgi:WXG100 family type VII secretion target
MPDERMDYEAMTKMANEFKNAQTQLTDTLNAMKNASKMIEGGALLGTGGDAFRDVINSKLQKKLTSLVEKMKDSESDIKKAIEENKKAVATGKKGF